jgi:hypothetical protein
MLELTKYELLDLAGTYHELALTAMMAYFSSVSAYLIVAHFAGVNLKPPQVVLITGLFVIMALFMTWGVYAYFIIGQDYVVQSGREIPITRIQPHQIGLPLLLFGILASLKFMWDVRHPKEE